MPLHSHKLCLILLCMVKQYQLNCCHHACIRTACSRRVLRKVQHSRCLPIVWLSDRPMAQKKLTLKAWQVCGEHVVDECQLSPIARGVKPWHPYGLYNSQSLGVVGALSA